MIRAGPFRISTVVLSTALGMDGRGIFPYTLWPAYRALLRTVRETGTTILAKSVTRYPRRGNFVAANPFTWRYIRRLPGLGLLNAYGLTNPGVERTAPRVREAWNQGFQVIPNFWPDFSHGADRATEEVLSALSLYRQFLGEAFWALELNFSCPNVPEELACSLADGLHLVRVLKAAEPGLFLIAKLGIRHPYEFAQELERLGVDALHAVNTIPYELVFPPGRFPPSPLAAAGGGGVSGGPAFPLAYEYNRGLRARVRLPLILGCGITSLREARMYLELGAAAVSLCTLALRRPALVGELIRLLN